MMKEGVARRLGGEDCFSFGFSFVLTTFSSLSTTKTIRFGNRSAPCSPHILPHFAIFCRGKNLSCTGTMSRLGTLLTALSLLGVSSAETANRQAGMGFLDPLCISAVSASSGYATAVETGATTSSRVRCEKTSGVVALPSLPGLPSFPPTTYGPVVRKVLTTCESGLVKQVIQDCATTDTTCTGTCNNTQVHFYSEGEYNKKYSGQCSANNGSAWNATANDWLWTPASATMTGKSTVYQVAFGQSHEAVNPCTGQVVAPATGVPQRTAQGRSLRGGRDHLSCGLSVLLLAHLRIAWTAGAHNRIFVCRSINNPPIHPLSSLLRPFPYSSSGPSNSGLPILLVCWRAGGIYSNRHNAPRWRHCWQQCRRIILLQYG